MWKTTESRSGGVVVKTSVSLLLDVFISWLYDRCLAPRFGSLGAAFSLQVVLIVKFLLIVTL